MRLKKIHRWRFRTKAVVPMILLGSYAFATPLMQAASQGRQVGAYKGDVTDIRVVRRVESHPDAWRLWQPFIAKWKRNHLVVAFGAMTNGKKDMGDIFVSVSKDDGDTWGGPVAVFDHNRRQGTIQFAYANPVLYRQFSSRNPICLSCDKSQHLPMMMLKHHNEFLLLD